MFKIFLLIKISSSIVAIDEIVPINNTEYKNKNECLYAVQHMSASDVIAIRLWNSNDFDFKSTYSTTFVCSDKEFTSFLGVEI